MMPTKPGRLSYWLPLVMPWLVNFSNDSKSRQPLQLDRFDDEMLTCNPDRRERSILIHCVCVYAQASTKIVGDMLHRRALTYTTAFVAGARLHASTRSSVIESTFAAQHYDDVADTFLQVHSFHVRASGLRVC